MTSLERLKKLQKQLDKIKRAKQLAEANDNRIHNMDRNAEEDVYSAEEFFSRES